MSFTGLLRREPRALAFGLLHTVAATIGQTFVVSLFLPGIKHSFALGDAEVSLLFTGTTLASAAALWKIGAWIDRADLYRYAAVCGLFLAISCAIIAGAVNVAMLAAGLFCLRLAGNGLLTHVALTASARYFIRDRGQALSLVLLGSSIGEGGFPAPLVALIAAMGWRAALVLLGLFGCALVLAAIAGVRRDQAFRCAHLELRDAAAASAHRLTKRLQGDPRDYFRYSAALFVAMPMTITAMIFHQALIARAKGVSLEWFAIAFIAFAVSRVACSLAIGPIIDRFGSTRLFALHLVPLALGTAALIATTSPLMALVFWACAGITSGMGTVLQMTVVAERVPLERLGVARSLLGAGTIVASAIGPSLYGAALALGAGIAAILWGSIALLIAASALGAVPVWYR